MQLRIIIVVLGVAACGGDARDRGQSLSAASQPGVPSDHPGGEASSTLSPAARASLDSGNAAFRSKRYVEALALYSRAADAAPGNASPWFGVYMVAVETKQQALADSAMKEVRKRAPAVDQPAPPRPAPDTASLFNPHAAPPGPIRGN